MARSPDWTELVGDVAWDDMREQRVLARVRAKSPVIRRRRQRRRIAGLALGTCAAVAASVWLALGLRSGPPPSASETPAALAALDTSGEPLGPQDPADAERVLQDGSRLRLHAGATVHVDEQSESRTRIVQDRGRVTYDVRRRQRRTFSVKVGWIEVRVIGTAFAIDMSDRTIQVAVRRGLVEVRHGGRITKLSADEQLRVPRQADRATEQTTSATSPPETEVSPSAETSRRRRSAKPRHRRVRKSTVADPLLRQIARIDALRSGGRLDEAARSLRRALRQHPADPRTSALLFTLGRVERSRHRPSAAAKAFQRCHEHSPRGGLAEDAMAEEAKSWKAARMESRAQQAAHLYLATYPRGIHRSSMERLVTADSP